VGLAGLRGLRGLGGIVPGVAAPGGFTCSDPDGAAYISAVEAADGQALEDGVKQAFCQFFTGCKADASPFAGVSNYQAMNGCILMGARTLAGAVVPFRGPGATGINFVSGDYSRVAGLAGNGTNKRMLSNFVWDTGNINNNHMVLDISNPSTVGVALGGSIGGSSTLTIEMYRQGTLTARNMASVAPSSSGYADTATGFIGMARSTSSSFIFRVNDAQTTLNQATAALSVPGTPSLFSRSDTSTFVNYRLRFYSFGAAVTLSALNARIATLRAEIAAALA
jgi:hypothetical protein